MQKYKSVWFKLEISLVNKYCLINKNNVLFFLKRKLWSLSNFFNVYTCIYENNERSDKSKNLSENKKIIKIFKGKKHSKYIYLLEVDIHLHSKDWENGKQGRINLLNASNI